MTARRIAGIGMGVALQAGTMKGSPLAAVLTLLCAAGAPAAPRDEFDDATKKLLGELRQPSSAAALLQAANTLRQNGGPAAQEAGRLLTDLVDKRRRAVDAATDRINRLVAGVGGGDGQAPLVERWVEARAHANAWLFDAVKFPPPRKQPVTSPEIGYEEAKARGDNAITAHKALRPALDAATTAVGRLNAATAQKWRASHAEALADWHAAWRALHGDAVRLQGVGAIDRVAGLLLALASDDYAAAAAAYRELPEGWAKLCAFHAYGRRILARDAADACGMGKQAVRGCEQNNWYRMSLGISPLWHNGKLTAAAQGHSDEMVKLGYFGHDSPVAANDSPQKRVANAGYRGGCTECCSSSSTASSAMEMWKWDGGHHRAMIHWEWTEVGCSDRGPCTLNPGAGEAGAPPGIRY